MLDDIDAEHLPSKAQIDKERSTAVNIATIFLFLCDKKHLVETLLLIVENGWHLKRFSIAALCRDKRKRAGFIASKRRYERNRKALLEFFMSQECTRRYRGGVCDIGEVPMREPRPRGPFH